MSSMNIPSASAVSAVSAVVVAEHVIPMDALVAQFKNLSVAELFKVSKAVIAQLEKSTKNSASKAKASKAAKPKKLGANNGAQLVKPRKWVEFVLKHAKQEGWEAFETFTKKKDKSTGETTVEVVQMPASVCIDGVYYYDGSSDKNGKPKTMIPRDAMTLSKLYWSNKTQTGLRQDLYEAFEAQYDSIAALEIDSSLESAVESAVESDGEAESVVSSAATAASAAAASAASDASDTAKKPRAKRTESQKAATTATKAKNREAAAASASDADEKEEAVVSTPVKAAKKTKKSDPDAPKKAKAAPKKAKKGEWSCEDDGDFHPWTHEGANYLRNFKGHIFKASENGEVEETDWVGVWNNDTKEIDVTYLIPEEYITVTRAM